MPSEEETSSYDDEEIYGSQANASEFDNFENIEASKEAMKTGD